jgi:two-component system nitrate/nitrite response regulator NarL
MPKRVLIADDNKIVRKMLKLVLARMPNVEVCAETTDGRSTVERAREVRPDLLILDVRMPELTGVEVASILKKDLPQAKILLFTMYTDLVGPSIAAVTGVDIVLPKADGAAALVRAIDEIVRDESAAGKPAALSENACD